ncbi:MAG: hypothetical protein V3U26_00945 [Dehalococcoidia bacterium]
MPKWPVVVAALAVAALAFALTSSTPAHAHGFGPRYDLPVPLYLYLIGAGAAVALSFVVIGAVLRGSPGLHGYPRLDLLRWRLARSVASPETLFVIKVASVSLFILMVLTGLFGDQRPDKNLTPTLIWVLWWVGTAYVSAFLGNVWALVNPWKITFGWAEGLYKRLNPQGRLSLTLPYPQWLGYWPGVALFGAFSWVENVYPGSAEPRDLSVLVLLYSAVTWSGMFLFGRNVWLRHGEAFSLIFGFLSRFAPTQVRVREPEACQTCSLECRSPGGECVDCYECYERAGASRREWNLRPFAAGLLLDERVRFSQMAFVLLMLATVSFDGFTATSTWSSILRDTFDNLSFLGGQALTGAKTAGLVWFTALFPLAFLLVTALVAAFSGTGKSPGEVARVLVYSLIPIALAYHLAHFFSFLIIQGQSIIPLASDPFGYGWDLFGTSDYRPNIGIINARTVWFTSIAAIVIGHIVAVYVAHIVALRVFRDRRLAQRSQYPMLALMVGYTMLSLWILAQPIMETAV